MGGQEQRVKSVVMCNYGPGFGNTLIRECGPRQQPGNLNDSQPENGASKCSLPEIYVRIDLPCSFLQLSSYSLAPPPSRSLLEEMGTLLAAGDISEAG